jgi:hypothetical protein
VAFTRDGWTRREAQMVMGRCGSTMGRSTMENGVVDFGMVRFIYSFLCVCVLSTGQ